MGCVYFCAVESSDCGSGQWTAYVAQRTKPTKAVWFTYKAHNFKKERKYQEKWTVYKAQKK